MKLKLELLTASIYLISVTLHHVSKAEVFSAMADVENLLTTEKTLIESLERYLQLEEERLNKLRKFNKMYSKLYDTAKNGSAAFLSNPVNAFLLVKHLTSDWNITLKLIDSNESRDAMTFLRQRKDMFPVLEDLEGASEALMRLQSFYLLDAASVASGQMKGSAHSPELSASDCFELGKQAYDVGWSNYSLMWMEETLKRVDDDEVYELDKAEIMEYLAFSAYEVGNFSYGLQVTQEITKIKSNYTRLYDNLAYYQQMFAERENLKKLEEEGLESAKDPKMLNMMEVEGRMWSEREMINEYERLCRGEAIQTEKEKSKLFCYYSSVDKYYWIGPNKVEVLNLKPRIVRFYDVISDKEMSRIKKIAAPMLQRAVVQDSISGEIEVTTDRISKSTVLENYHHKVVGLINKRIQYITGITVKSAEPIHVINYGIGGHYDPHFDFAQGGDKIELFNRLGNRMSTWIYYMSDVTAGGSTVFPTIGVEVKPVKGAAVFWHNLKANGEGDKRTLHAACPVLSGSKWVGNKWLHEVGNEFRRPCSLNSEE